MWRQRQGAAPEPKWKNCRAPFALLARCRSQRQRQRPHRTRLRESAHDQRCLETASFWSLLLSCKVSSG